MPRTFKVTAHSVDEMRATVLEYYATRIPADDRSDAALERIRKSDGLALAVAFGNVSASLAQEEYARQQQRRSRAGWLALLLYLAAGALYGIRAAILSPDTRAFDGLLGIIMVVLLIVAGSVYAFSHHRPRPKVGKPRAAAVALGAALQLRRDLASVAQDLDALYPNRPAPPTAPSTPSGISIPEAETPAPTSIEMQAHLLGPEHLGRFIEVRVAAELPRPGHKRPAGPLAGRLVGYRAAVQPFGPGAPAPIRAFELLIQQGPSTTTAIVSWADLIRIA